MRGGAPQAISSWVTRQQFLDRGFPPQDPLGAILPQQLHPLGVQARRIIEASAFCITSARISSSITISS